MLDEKYTGNGKVVLLAGGGKIYGHRGAFRAQ